ncbi:spherulation-specific family 4 protein [Terriglobus aquaticus]|uniref:Spherulation-specific family 4 protein n=1 Tax=Terriglobus aquaticus TaxID=940139 RepID=A0ABW9KSH3_9BACT|nr:spherulation-specific family 4 protein [Terriglobus aquaticus]
MPAALLATACVLFAGSAFAQTGQPTGCESLVVPSYMGPGPGWDTMIASAPKTGAADRILIVNPASGPGMAARPGFRDVVQRVKRTGQKVYGYVPTGYGARSMQSVEDRVRKYVDWYGVDGIFFDEVSDKAPLVPRYYQPLVTFTTSQIRGGGVMLNNGTFPAAAYATIKVPAGSKFQLVVFEHDYRSFTKRSFTVPRWVAQHPSSMFVSIVYAASASQLPEVLRLSAERNFGTVYVTDKDLPNPYGVLPDYWDALSRATQPGCSR